MRQILDEITLNLDRPTPEDIELARMELEANEGQFFGGVKVYLSKQPAIRDVQIRCWAYHYGLQRKALKAIPEPILTPEQEAEKQIQQSIAREKQLTRSFMGKDSIFAGISLSDPTTVENQIVKWLTLEYNYSKKRNALLIGPPGCGKTFGAVGYVAAKTANPSSVQFITAYKLSEYLIRKEFDFLDKVERVQWLIIDEFGTVPPGYKLNEFTAYFENLFNTRHRNQQHTILTSNLNVEQIKQLCGDRFTSRFNEDGEIFISDDSDFRGGLNR